MTASGTLLNCSYVTGAAWNEWSELTAPPGHPVTKVAACRSHTEGRQDLAVLTADGRLWTTYKHHQQEWSNWKELDAPAPLTRLAMTSPFATIAGRPGQLTIFAVDLSGSVWQKSFHVESGWSEWTSMRFPHVAVSLAAGSLGDGHQEVFVVDLDDTIWHSWWNWGGDGWSQWIAF